MSMEQYPQPINIEFTQDKIALLDNLQEGDSVKVGINLRGREWTSPQGEVKYFNSITGWRIEKLTANTYEPTTAMPTGHEPRPQASESGSLTGENVFDDDDDLPF